jgi:LacI family transcriptional regulator
MMAKNIRIKDIAKMAGVSEGTVDRVLHNRGNVSAEALTRVNDVLKKIQYKPNLIARSLGRSRNFRVAVLIPDPKQDPYWAEANAGIIQARGEWENYGVTIDPYFYVHEGDLSLELIASQSLKSKPDGMVIAPIFYPQALHVFNQLQKIGIPYVLFNANIPKSKPLSFIGQDLFQSGKLAGELMSIGSDAPEEIAILHIGEDIKDSIYLIEKDKGFREYYERNIHHPFKITSLNLDSDEKANRHSIEELVKNKNITGLFVTTSKAVPTVARVLQTSARADIRLIGYDMLQENLKYLKSGAISFLINQNPKRQAFQGISHMVNHLLFKKEIPRAELFPLEVITQQNVDSYIASGIH